MRHRSRPAQPVTGTVLGLAGPNRRRHFRHTLRHLAYVKMGSDNGGALRDLSEVGLATQALGTLQANQPVRLLIDLPSPRLRLEAEGRVAWSDASGVAGVELLNLTPQARRSLKDWIFDQLLAEACRTAGGAGQLSFSESPRPAILLPQAARQTRDTGKTRLRIFWFSVSPRFFSRLVDGMALLCAVLLFSVVTLTLTDTLPSWTSTLLLLMGVAGIFAGLYWALFSAWFGVTPGRRLADLSARDSLKGARTPGGPRFR